METKGDLNEECCQPERLKPKNHNDCSLSFCGDWFEFEHEYERVSEDANLRYKGQRKTVFQVVLRTGLLTLCEVGPYWSLIGKQSESGNGKGEILHSVYGLIMGSKGNLTGEIPTLKSRPTNWIRSLQDVNLSSQQKHTSSSGAVSAESSTWA